MIKKVTNSEIQCFKNCRREWWLAHYRRLGLRRREHTGPAQLGSLVHECLEQLYVNGVNPTATLEHEVNLVEALDPFETPKDRKAWDQQVALAKLVIEGFMQWQAEVGLDCGYEVVAVEERVEVPVNMPRAPSWEDIRLLGKLDIQVRREADGAILNRDWKTVGTLDEGRLTEHEQFRFYALIKRLKGDVINGAQRVMLRKVKRTASAKPPFYGIDEALYTDTVLRNFYRQVHGTVSDIAQVHAALDAGGDPLSMCYPRPSRDCDWKCQFKPVCPMFTDGSNAEGMLEAYYVEHDPLERYDTGKTNDVEDDT